MIFDVLIIGGGLAGLTSAVHLSQQGLKVLLIEKNTYPHHKVCGEYVSLEVLSYLQALGADPLVLHPSRINRFQLSNIQGKSIQTKLPLGGFGLSRYAFDQYLSQMAVEKGCTLVHESVSDVTFSDFQFRVQTERNMYQARLVLGAYGKRSQLDRQLGRNFFGKKSPWLAVKAHYRGDFPDDLVALHNFRGGYCGVSKVENDILNICYLVNYDSFKAYRNISEHQEQVLYQNLFLKDIFENSKCIFENPLTISQVSFQEKEKVHRHMLMIGDTAGLIHPLCGNGMSMAIHAAKIASTLTIAYFEKQIKSHAELEVRFEQEWKRNFQQRMHAGRVLSGLLRQEKTSSLMMYGLMAVPQLLGPIIRRTHGKSLMLS